MALGLHTKLDTFPGIGPARARALGKLGLHTVGELLHHYPRDYEDRSLRPDIRSAGEEMPVCFRAMVTEAFHTSRIRQGMELTRGRVADHTAQVTVTFFNQPYMEKQLRHGEEYLFYGRLQRQGAGWQLANPYVEALGADRLTGGIIPVYPLTAGISQALLGGLVRRALPAAGDLPEALPPGLLARYQLAQSEFSYRNIHFPESWEALALAKRRLIFEELLCLSLGLTLLRARRSRGEAPVFRQADLTPFLEGLPFRLTGAQSRAVEELSRDLTGVQPMNRLLQGDVGSGKTVVAAAGAYLAWQNGFQSALMAPTELLARQHLTTMEALLAGSGLRVGLLVGSLTAAEKRRVRARLATGEIDLLVGTHALVSQGVEFSRLGLVITDEQHRFGVGQRAALSAKGGEMGTPHVLVMSATPIPRTLALMIYGDLDLSVLDELPPGRTPVATSIMGEDKRERMYGFIRRQAQAGHQTYIVCPTVEEGGVLELKAAEEYGRDLQEKVFPDLRTAVLHGRMKGREKEAVMDAFVRGEIAVLVSTTVIEVGVDVPRATLMVIENAERFGLSQLHQLRGRVGRGSAASYCILVTESRSETARERLRALAATNDGFLIAEEDLRLRGPGDFFGARQHGLPQLQIASLAGDMRVLSQAQEAAKALLEEDPDLEAPRHAPLREQVWRLFEENRTSFN